ncbi:MAG TPA: 2OG-Fe(II) oxygenase [Blastocatellia bacterium]
MASILNLARLDNKALSSDPYRWALIDGLYHPRDAAKLAATFPTDHFKTVDGYDGEKSYSYEARSLIGMGNDSVCFPQNLSDAWRRLGRDLASPAYKHGMSRLTGRDLTRLSIEANVFHYGAGAWLGPHVDLKDKMVTHVLYFNKTWDRDDGGCLNVLRSSDLNDSAAEILPVVGNSVVIVRSDRSWHAVSRVPDECRQSRRSLTVTFYAPSSVSTMWPPGEQPPLHDYGGVNERPSGLSRLMRLFS